MKLKKYTLGALGANCYVLINEENNNAVAIDIGGDEGFLLLEEIRQNFKITNVLLTHAHFDHIGGVYKFYERGANVYVGAEDEEMIEDGNKNLSSHFGGKIKPFKAFKRLFGGEKLNLEGIEIEVIATPGHTKGGLSFMVGNMLFTGDTLFSSSFGRTDFPGGDIKELSASIKKLFALGDKDVYSGHGGKTTLEIERNSNPIKYYD